MSLTAIQVKDLIDQLWTRAGSNRVGDDDLRTVGKAIVDLVAATDIDIFPDWGSGLTFQTDGSDDGKYCKYPDTNGKKRIFETKVDDNIGNAPPTDPLITETTEWKEISQSAKSGIVEWSAGVYGEGLIIVYWKHSTDGNNFYILKNPTRPFTSANIETEIVSGDWEKIPLKTEGHYRGLYTSLVNLESALPTANPGDFADVDPGSGTDLVRYAWDEDEGWVPVSGGGAVSGLTPGRIPFATSSSTLGDDADLSWDNINKVLVLGGAPSGGMSIFADYSPNRDNLIFSDGMNDWAGVLGLDNFGVGSGALYSLYAGNHNHAIGAAAGGILTDGEHNELIGRAAGGSLVNGSANVIIGAFSDISASSSGNVLLGYNQQGPTTGGRHVLIGYNVESVHPTANGELSIQNAIYGVNNTAGTTTLSAGNIGIYVQSPTARLHLVAGEAGAGKAPLKLTTGTALTTPEDGAIEYHGSHLYFTIGSTRYQLDQQGGGGALSGLTAATAINTINNAGHTQEWQWNSLAGATGLKLSSNSTAATGNAQTLLEVNLSGANASSGQTTYGAKIINTKTGTLSGNVGLYVEVDNGETNTGIDVKGGVNNNTTLLKLQSNSGSVKFSVGAGGAVQFPSSYLYIASPGGFQAYIGQYKAFGIRNKYPIGWSNLGANTELSPTLISGDYTNGEISFFAGESATPIGNSLLVYGGLGKQNSITNYERGKFGWNSTVLEIGAQSGGTGILRSVTFLGSGFLMGGSSITTNAILDLQSTTKAFIPPRMTTTQRDAIGTPSAGMVIYNTTTNKLNVYTTAWEAVTSS